ncbi:MAG: hypothetical protein J0M24_10345 [Verrucomicrobia bacterium]|nr:hypothetical protein [Verrucomicrobiota bacterium]
MNLSSLTSADLQRLAKLISLKETHLAEITKIDAELAGFGSASAPGAKRGRPARANATKAPKAKRSGKRGGRGKLMEKIIGLLKEAGKGGLPVKSIAESLKLKPQNIHVWFSSTGRKVKEIKKLSPGTFAWVG